MKKLLVILFSVFAISAYAESFAEQLAASNQRIQQLATLIAKQPKACGFAEIDDYANAIGSAAKLSIANSEALNSICTAVEAGNKPAVADVLALAKGVKEESEKVTEASKKSVPAGEALKNVAKNPMKAKGAKNVMDFANNAATILSNESVTQTALINELVGKYGK